MNRTTFTTCALLGTATLFTACSSSSSDPDVTAPAFASATQNRTVDNTGATVDVRFNERIAPDAANDTASWTASAGNILSATLQADERTVRLVMDQLTVPGDVTFGTIAGTAAAGNIDLSAQVTDGDTVTISDGTTALTFEFTSGAGASGTNIEVDKGLDASDAIAALITAIEAQTWNITAAAGLGDSADLTNDELGVDGNVALAETDAGGVITLTGMTGGAGIQDLRGNVIETAITGFALSPSETVAPSATSVAGLTIEGADNDQITVVFNDNMIESEVEDVSNWTIEAPIGTAFDPTNASVDYDDTTMTATVTLGNTVPGIAAADANNLQTFDSIRVAFANVRDLSGNTVPATNFDGTIGGDTTPPTLENVAATGATDTALLRFSEPMKEVAFGDLYSGGTDAGARFILSDQDAVAAAPATGSITISGNPIDGETFVVTDALATAVTFEWDDNASTTGTNVAIAIVLGNNDTMATNVASAINGSTLDITPATASNVVNLTQDTDGAAGNVAITGTVTNVAFVGMTGGLDQAAADATIEAAQFLWSADGASLTLDYDVNPEDGVDTFSFYGVEDLAGNQAFPLSNLVVGTLGTNEPDFSTGASVVEAVAGVENDEITVVFDEPMSAANILEPTNYTAAPLDLTAAEFSFDGIDTVTIALNDASAGDVQFGTNYTMTLVNNPATPLTTLSGVEITGDATEVIAGSGDNVPISAAAGYVGATANTCVIEFAEAPEPVGATTVGNYDIGAVNPTAVTQLSARAFELTFAAQPTATDTVDIAIAGATDIAGNAAGGVISVALTAADVTAPTATFTIEAATDGGPDFATVAFSESVDPTLAVDSANYVFTAGGSVVPMTGANLTYDAENESVQVEFADTVNLQFGDTVALAISNVADFSGNALSVQPANATVAGDNSAPGFASATSAFVNYIADAAGTTIDVLFDEAVDATFAGTLTNWSTSGATVLQSVTVVSPTIVRFTTNAPIAASETIDVTNLVDLAGNVNTGAISVDPLQ